MCSSILTIFWKSKNYVDSKTLWEVSRDMEKSYSWVSKVHSKGTKSIQKILDARKCAKK